ncbi:MAG: hypothetical protein AAF415_06625 [Pseudomonadota bacterium]
MLPMLTGIVVMLAVGMFIQRSDAVMEFLTGEGAGDATPIVLNADAIQTRARNLKRIDVLANDTGLGELDRSKLVIVAEPDCGDVFVQSGALQYLASSDCTQFQTISYAIEGDPNQAVGTVQVRILGAPVTPRQAPTTADLEADALARLDPNSDGYDEALANRLRAEAEAAAEQAEQPVEPEAQQEDPAPASASADAPAQPTAQPQAETELAALPSGTSSTGEGTGDSDVTGDQAVSNLSEEIASPDAPGTLSELTNPPVPRQRVAVIEPRVDQPVAPETTDLNTGLVNATAAPSAAPQTDELLAIGSGAEASLAIARVEIAEPSFEAPDAPSFDPDQADDLVLGQSIAQQRATPDAALQRAEIAALSAAQVTFDDANKLELSVLGAPSGSSELRDLDAPAPSASTAPRIARLTAIVTGSPDAALNSPELLAAPAAQPPHPEEPVEETPAAAPEKEETEVAALTPTDTACVLPPAMTLDVRPAAQTGVAFSAPCHPSSVVELQYSGLSFAIPTDAKGNGEIVALGFEQLSEAELHFADGEVMPFDLPFSGSDKVSRVAMSWDLPIELNLHALEFGAQAFQDGDVNAQNPRSFSDIRRRGGGYMSSYTPLEGRGEFVQIYTHFLKRRGKSGVVELLVDYASRDRDRAENTCGDGNLAKPEISILKTEQGRVGRLTVQRLAALGCADIPAERTLLSINTIGSLVVAP